MGKWTILILAFFILTGCQPNQIVQTLTGSETIIEWVDFINLDGKEYYGIHSAVLADESYVDKKIGEVQFRVADNVKNPSYRTKNGDAAFHEPGTEIYSIKNHDEFIAVKSQNSINGYQVYYLNESSQYKWHFKDMPLNEVRKIEIYLDTHLITELNNEEIEKFLDLLSNGVLETSFQPDTNQRDPIYYEMVFYTEEPIAYNYTLFFDGKTYYWYPWDTVVLSEKIGEFLK